MIQQFATSFNFLGYEKDTDFVDRMHSFVTTNLLILFATLVSFKQFGGRPIECMVPDTFTSAMEQYTEQFCWSRDTYMVPFEDEIPIETKQRAEKEISYYQWVPFFLLAQALCFRIPSIIWKYMAGQSGIRVHDLIKIAMDEKNIDPKARAENLQTLSVHIQNCLRFHRRLVRKDIQPHRIAVCLNLPYKAFYVTMLYLIVKLLYLLNVFMQLYYMNKFLMTDRHGALGFTSIAHLVNGSTWEMSGVFPRVTMCDIRARVLGGVQLFSIQCVLVINLFTEKIFVLLWFWFVILLVLTGFSFSYWFFVTIMPCSARGFVSRNLELADMPFDPVDARADVDRFVSGYLKQDGIFVLRMLTMHTSIIYGTELTKKLWDKYYGIEEQVKAMTPGLASAPPLYLDAKHGKNLWNNLRFRGPRGRHKRDYYDDDDLNKLKHKEFREDINELLQPIPEHHHKPASQVSVGVQFTSPISGTSLDQPDAADAGSYRSRSGSLSERRGSELRLKMPKSSKLRGSSMDETNL